MYLIWVPDLDLCVTAVIAQQTTSAETLTLTD